MRDGAALGADNVAARAAGTSVARGSVYRHSSIRSPAWQTTDDDEDDDDDAGNSSSPIWVGEKSRADTEY